MCSLGAQLNTGKHNARKTLLTNHFFFQKGPVCSLKQRNCIEVNSDGKHGCRSSCEGVYADVEKVEERFGSAKDGGNEKDAEAFRTMIEEYRKFKRSFVENIGFNASANYTAFGGFATSMITFRITLAPRSENA